MSLIGSTRNRWLFTIAVPFLLARSSPAQTNDNNTTTPVKHVIVIIGENRTFDHLFATYRPVRGQFVSNLLSKQIVNIDGTPGPNFATATQYQATNTLTYQLAPTLTSPYSPLVPPNTGGAPESASDTNPPPFATVAVAMLGTQALLTPDYALLTTGATGLPTPAVDTRLANYNNLPNGPFQLSPSIPYDAYAGSPVHRFYQMWQQSNCSASYATFANPSGCLANLFPWVEITIGAGSNGHPPPSPFTDQSTGEGSISMGFYNVAQGDMPYFKSLADTYTMSDNYHQAVMGGTGANHIALGSGDAFWYSDGMGNPLVPPANQITNPDPLPGTNNWYTQDGYSGGSYSNCADGSQPGVGVILSYLASLPYHPASRCQANHYYLLNNYNPGYFGDGTVNTIDTFTIPPASTPTIADVLLSHSISWKYYGEGWNNYVANPSSPTNTYCNICNFAQYTTSIMTNAAVRTSHLVDVTGANGLYQDLANGTLPAVSFVKPGGLLDGHPASSKFDLFEAFVHKILDGLAANPTLAADTAVFITVDEGGGYYDSGYIQPLDFFGDGTRIPLIVVSPWSTGGKITHSYADHVSILKFIEKNWSLPTVTSTGRDNFPNPIQTGWNPYAPSNGPAIGDLMDMFNFSGTAVTRPQSKEEKR